MATAQDFRRVRSAMRFVTDNPHSGSHFFVSSVHASAGTSSGHGYTPDMPLTTLHAASALCTASAGDTVHLLPGHIDTLTAAAQAVLDKAGVTVQGHGSGSLMPTIKLGTATTTDVDVDADNITFRNVRFQSDIDDLAVMLDVNEDYCTFEDCEFIGPATKECINFVNLATTKDNFVFRRCRWLQEADPTGTDGAAATGGIYIVDSENVLVEDCTFNGFFETACIHNKTTAMKYLTVRRTSTNQLLTTTGRKFLFPASTVGVQIEYASDPTWYPGLGYKVEKTEDGATVTSDALFTLTGKVKIALWTGEVTNALGATAKFSDYKIELTTLGGILVAAGDISSSIIGHMFTLNDDAGDTSLSTSTSAVSVAGVGDSQGKSGHLIVGKAGGSDVIKATRTAGDAGDAIIHTVFYMPLEPGACLIDAA